MRNVWLSAMGMIVAVAAGCTEKETPAANRHAGPGETTTADRVSKGPTETTARGAPLFADLGNYHCSVTTRSAEAQKYFDQGLTLTYAFNHHEAIRSFREAARLDPQCAIAWWGVALNYGPNINKPMDPADAPAAWEALGKAQALASNANDREKALIEALSKRYAEKAPEDRSALDKAYAEAMGAVHAKFPDDLDVACLYAESLMDLTPWDYYEKDGKPRASTAKALAAIEGVLARKPDHPGACHYYIHAVEAAEPARALASADRLLQLVPGAGHLVHMPAHIYLRMGLWREATVANELASRADQSYIAQCNAQGFYPAMYYPHNVHFMWYTNAMEGRSAASVAAAQEITRHAGHMKIMEEDRLGALLSMVYVRFGKWDEVLAQPTPAQDKVYGSAMSHYVRGLALSAKGDAEGAGREYTALGAIAKAESTKALDGPHLPGAQLIQIALHDLAGQLALKKGDNPNAVGELETAVKIEDGLPYMEPPFSYMPMRHGLGAALLAGGDAAAAEKVYREDLRRNPGNGWGLLGLAQSLKAQNKNEAADEVSGRFREAWLRADVKPTSSRY